MAVSARRSSGPRPIRGPGAWRVLTSATIAWNSLEVNDEVEVGSETCATCAKGRSWQDRRVEALECDTSIGSGEAPVDSGLLDVSVVRPGSDFADQRVLVRDTSV